MNQLAVVLVIALSSAALGQLVYKKNEQFKKTYIHHGDQRFSYDDAVKQCRSLNATIVEPRTAEQTLWLRDHFGLRDNRGMFTHFWIGLQKAKQMTPSLWMDGTRVTTPLWGGNSLRFIRCAVAVAYAKDGKWYVANCSEKWYLVCEKDDNVIITHPRDSARQEMQTQIDQLRDSVAEIDVQIESLTKDKVALMRRITILTETIERLSKQE